MSLWMWKRGSFATSCIKSYIAVTHFMIPLKWCDLLICGVERKIFIFSPSNYRDYHTDFSCSGYFFTSLLPYVSTSVSQNVSIKDNVKNYLVPSRMSIDFWLEERQWLDWNQKYCAENCWLLLFLCTSFLKGSFILSYANQSPNVCWGDRGMRQHACSILFQKGNGKSWLPQRKKKQNNGVEAEDLGGLKEKRRENMRKKRRGLGRGWECGRRRERVNIFPFLLFSWDCFSRK